MENSASSKDLRSPAKMEDDKYPDIPKSWGFVTLKRNKKK